MASPKNAGKGGFAQESAETKAAEDRLSEEELAARDYMADETAWEQGEGEEFGGKSEILILRVGELAGPLVYVGHQEMTTSLGETTVHMATTKNGDTMRLPIQATFLRSVDQAGLVRGDTFLVKRFEDQIKKQGKGKGNPMAFYGLRVVQRAPRQMAAAV